MREYVSKCFVDYAAYPNEEWDLSREEAIYLCRDSRAGLDSLTQIPLSQKNLRRFCSLRPSPWGGGRSGVSCCSSQFYISKRFFFARVINWTIIILQYAHTHTGRSLKWQAGGVAWLFVEKLSITAQKAVTHDRQRIFPWNILQIQNNKLHACFVLEQQCAVIMHRLSVSAEIISTTGLLKGDERLHLDQQGGPQ